MSPGSELQDLGQPLISSSFSREPVSGAGSLHSIDSPTAPDLTLQTLDTPVGPHLLRLKLLRNNLAQKSTVWDRIYGIPTELQASVIQPEMIHSSPEGVPLTVGAAAVAEGAGPGAEDPQIQGDLPEASRTSGNACSSSAAPGLRGRGHLRERSLSSSDNQQWAS